MAAAQDNLACKGTGMNWYTSMVGETPCQTYQKLRQICNSQFTVGVMNPNTPPDFCTDQVSTCCCNNIAFSLAMLCLNCQQDIGTSTGIDAGVGAYQIYLNGSTGTQSCANPQSGKLPNDIQTAACNQKIKINNDIYTNGWPDGSWFYVFTRDTIVKDNIVANNNSFTHCASTTINTSSSSSASGSKTASSNKPSGTQAGSGGGGDNNTNATSKSSSLATGAIAGIAVGAAVLAIAAVLAFWFCRKRQRRTQAGVLGGPFEGRSSAGGGRETAVLNDSLVAHGYNYTSDEATASRTPATSDYFAAPQSEAGGSSVPGFAGLGAGSAAGVGYGVGLGTAYAAGGPGGYDPHSTSSDGGQISPRRGFHTTGASTSSFASLPNPHGGASAAGVAAVGAAAAAAGSTSGSGSGRDRSGSGAASGAASLSGSSGRQEERRAQAPPLPRKRTRGAAAPAAAAAAAPAVGRAPSEEPFLEEEDHDREPWRDVDLDLDRHQDGGPVSDVSLGRSASGRLPPAYGAIHPER